MTPRPVPTPASLRLSARRLDRRITKADTALTAMRQGRLLCLEYRDGSPRWSLDDGSAVSPDIAAVITRSPSVAPAADSLFPNLLPGQVWRIRDDS